MVAKVTADIREVAARLAKLKADGQDTGKVLGAFGGVILNRIRLGFRLGRSPAGSPWAALKLRDGAPLRNTGALRNSITMQVGRGQVTIGTNRVGARVHQFGATIKPKTAKVLAFPGPGGTVFAKQVTIPARPFMPLSQGGDVAVPPAWVESGLQAMKRALEL